MTDPRPRDRSEVHIEVVDDERVVARGSRFKTWFVRQGEGWTKAAEWPGATVERRSSAPGTVWERAVFLTLPVGTELMRVETAPRSVVPKDPLSYLRGSSKDPPRTTHRWYYRLDARGRLNAIPAS